MKNLILAALLLIALPAYADPMRNFYHIDTNKNIYNETNIKDVINIPQNSKALNNLATNYSKKSFAEYYSSYFLPWDASKDFDSTVLQNELSKRSKRYSESYQLITEAMFETIEKNANIQAISSLKHKAIVINNTNLRTIPTNTQMFSNPNAAGAGYPFDHVQDDFLNIGEPLLISHYTTDGKFAYALTSTGSCGFVLSKDLVEVNDKYSKLYRKNLIMLNANALAYLDSKQSAATIELYRGTILPLLKNKMVMLPVRNSKGEADLQAINLDKSAYISKPLSFSKKNVAFAVDGLIAKPYGWGGNLFHMDCARLVRSYFALFGIHMPLYSKEQGQTGEVLDVSTLDSDQKKNKITEYAIPYQSIIYLPGHIGIYLGEYNGAAIMLHAPWGLKLYDQDNIEYRYIIGKSIISTLSPGAELPGFSIDKSNLLNKISAVSNI